MINDTRVFRSLSGPPAWLSAARIFSLTVAVALAAGGALALFGQAQPEAPKPAKTVKENKPAAKPEGKTAGKYAVHQSLEMGGRITNTSGSDAMWSTLVNMGTGARVIGQSLEMHSTDTSKTKFFDNLNSSSFGYGGDPYDVTRLKFNKGRIYDFDGSFRRDRNYFDYNLLDNSLLSTSTAATPALVQEPDSLHLFNTVRRNTDTMVTLFPLSMVSVRAGVNFGVHAGPTYSSLHYAGDVQLLDMFKNSFATYIAGADVKLAKRTTLSYDQFFVFFKGDTSFTLAGVGNAVLNGDGVYPVKGGNGELVSLGVDTLATATCGTGANKSAEVVNGLANPFCSGTFSATSTAPIRTHFPTEQLRFSSRYWDKVSFNGRVLYSGGISRVNHFNETFNGWNTRTFFRQEIQTGGMMNGQLADNKRDNTNADFGMVADLSRFISVSDVVDFWNMRTSGYSVLNTQTWYAPGSSLLTPLNSITPCVPGAVSGSFTCPPSPATNTAFLNQKITSNTLMGTASITSKVKVSGGWRYKTREITDDGDDLTWHENWLLLGGVFQPSRMFRINANFDTMNSKSADADTTPSNTYTREAPNALYHLRIRATAKPANWLSLSGAVNDYSAKNDDPLVNHTEHNRDYSFGAAINPTEQFSIDLNYAYDDVFSKTDLCYAFTPNPQAPLPSGAANAGTCTVANSPDNGDPSYFLGFGNYDAPVNFFSGAVSYSPGRLFHFSGGARLNYTNGTAEQLNPLMVPGALQSHYITPFADVEFRIAPQWTWHGNFTRTEYSELGAVGPTASRNVTGNVTTLSVRYAF